MTPERQPVRRFGDAWRAHQAKLIAEDDGQTDDLNPDGTPRNRVRMLPFGQAVTGVGGPLARNPYQPGQVELFRDLLARFRAEGNVPATPIIGGRGIRRSV